MMGAISRGSSGRYIAERCEICVEEMNGPHASKHVRGVLYDGIDSREPCKVGDDEDGK